MYLREAKALQLKGEHVLPVDRERLWELLSDPEVLQAATPGCESLEPKGEDEYTAVFKLGIAAIRGTYQGRVALQDKEPPEGYTLVIEVSGSPGFVHGSARFLLEPVEDNKTRMTFDGEAQVGGLIAAVGQRILEGVGKVLVGQFFKGLEQEVRKRTAA